MKKGFFGNIEKLTVENNNFRKVLYTGNHLQLALMSLLPGEEIGLEIHNDNDQFFRFEEGEGRVFIDGYSYDVREDDVVVIPAGSEHNVINMSNTKSLKMYTLYGPSHHKDGIVRFTKKEAVENEADFDGVTTE